MITGEVDRRCNFRVELSRPQGFARIQLRDEREEILSIWEHTGGTNRSQRSFPLTEGRTPVVSASEQARTLLFLGGDGEVLERMPIHLVPGQLNLIQR